MKKFLIGFGLVVLLAVAIPAVLIFLNRLPGSVADRLSFVKTYVVEGDVRMTDGTTLPDEPVTVEVSTVRGKRATTQANVENRFHYQVTWMGFREPVKPGETLHVRATMPRTDTGPDQQGPTTRLLADFDLQTNDPNALPTKPENEILQDRRLHTWSETPPKDIAGWRKLPLSSIRNFPELQIDTSIRLIAVVQPMKYSPEEPSFAVSLPNAPDRDALRATPLSDLGEVLVRTPFEWEKKRVTVPFTYPIPRNAFVSVRIDDATGRRIRTVRLGMQPKTPSATWEWDGKDDSGAYADPGPYTFTASSNSLDLGPTPKPFIAEIAGRGGVRLRYVEFSEQSTIGDMIDTLGLVAEEGPPQGDMATFNLTSAVRLFTARKDGNPRWRTGTFRGDETLDAMLSRLDLEIDPVVSRIRRLGRYRFIVRGGAIQTNVPLATLRSSVEITSRDEFLNLPLTSLDTEVEGTFVPLGKSAPIEVTITQEPDVSQLEDWQRPTVRRTRVTVAADETVNDLLERLNAIPDLTAIVRGDIVDVQDFGARLVAPKGANVTFYGSATTEPGRLRANIRAAGVAARVVFMDVTPPLPGDGRTTVPIEATVIGLDGMMPKIDLVSARASQGTIGRMQRSVTTYTGTYTVPQTTTNVEATVRIESKALRDARAALASETLFLPVEAEVKIDVEGVEPPVVVQPEEGPASATTAGTTTAAGTPAAGTPAAAPTTPPVDQAALRKLAKLYAKMKPASAAQLLLTMPNEEARSVLMGMQEREAAKIVETILSSDAEGVESLPPLDQRKQQLFDILSNSDGTVSRLTP